MNRSVARFFLAVAVQAVVATLTAYGSGPAETPSGAGRVLFVGMDGMDPVLLRRLMDEGKLPNFKRLADRGDFKPLATSMPPQSPVAWSNVISGGEPGVHEIYDFIHRDPKTYFPYLSTSTIDSPAKNREPRSLGRWQLPLSAQQPKLRREGPAFWEYLVEHGIDTTVYRMPANYPAQEAEGHGHFHCLTGMGTPDLLGSYGDFTVFTSDPARKISKVSGGKFVRLVPTDHRATGTFVGPPNFLLKPVGKKKTVPDMELTFEVVRDPERDLVKITLGDDLLLLEKGEWSEWIQFDFETGIPGSAVLESMGAPTSIPGMVRLYVKQVHPELEIFATPINIDPSRPANPISVPNEFSADLAEATGLYFTAGIPEHTPEIQQGGLTEEQWLEKAHFILEERIGQFRHALKSFDDGCLFYYFGTPDLISHIFWRDQDPEHPGRDPQQGDRYADVIDQTYQMMDGIVGEAMAAVDDADTLIVMSDHGFASFRWGFNLNTWLLDNGYLALTVPSPQGTAEMLKGHVNWFKTRAYGLGLNGLYINQFGRERDGIVAKGPPTKQLLSEISEKLLQVRDQNGAAIIARTYIVADVYPDADPKIAPDMLIGYARNYRASWKTVLGAMPSELVVVNTNRWSGDHCIAADLVPGILVSSRKITVDDPALTDLGPTVLDLFGLKVPETMIGRKILETRD